MRTYAKRGFTLIELLVVIAIIGLLSTLAVVAMSSARQKARDAKRVSDVKQMQTALDLYATDKNGYPMVAAAKTMGTDVACLNDSGLQATAPCSGNVYMAKIPTYPTPASTGTYTTYTYTSYSDSANTTACTSGSACTSYRITFSLEGDTGELKATAPNKTPNCIATPGGVTCS